MHDDNSLENIDLIGRHCPRALVTYLMLLGRANDFGTAVFTKREISETFNESYTKFRNNVRALAMEGLLEWHEMGDTLHVTLGDYDA